MSGRTTLQLSEKRYAVLVGAAVVVLTTTVPYLTLLNVFLFAGIFLAGTIALTSAILRYQVPLSYNEAFFTGLLAGLLGGVLAEGVAWLLIAFAGYRPGTESLSLVVDWVVQMAEGNPELQGQVAALLEAERLALAPVTPTLPGILASMAFSSAFYGPLAGLGALYAVFRLKRKASRG